MVGWRLGLGGQLEAEPWRRLECEAAQAPQLKLEVLEARRYPCHQPANRLQPYPALTYAPIKKEKVYILPNNTPPQPFLDNKKRKKCIPQCQVYLTYAPITPLLNPF